MAAIIYAHRVHDAKMRKGYGLARTGSTEDVSTVTAMMLAIGEGEGCSAAHAHVGVDPFWRLSHVSLHRYGGHMGGLTALLSSMLLEISSLGGKSKPSCCRVW